MATASGATTTTTSKTSSAPTPNPTSSPATRDARSTRASKSATPSPSQSLSLKYSPGLPAGVKSMTITIGLDTADPVSAMILSAVNSGATVKFVADP